MKGFFGMISDDIYSIGLGYKRVFCAVFSFFAKIFRFVFGKIGRFFAFIFTAVFSTVKKYAGAVIFEFRKFSREVKKALPVLRTYFRKSPVQGIGKFFKFFFRAFSVHERFARAVMSTVIPVIAVIFLVSMTGTLRSVVFAVDIFIEGQNVGTLRTENDYKAAESEALRRFSAFGSNIDIASPEYRITLTTIDNLEDTETVCNNIIAASSENAVNACGIYADGEFIGAVGSEDTFARVSDEVLSAYAEENGFTGDGCKVQFAEEIRTVTGLYPDGVKLMTAQELSDYMTGYKTEHIEHTVSQGEDIDFIAEKYGMTVQEILELNKELDESVIPEGSVLLIKEGERNLSFRATKTYITVETIPFDTVSQFDNNVHIGTTMTIVPGVEGQDIVSYTDTFLDGKIVDSEREILRYNARSAVNELIKIGTMGIPVGDNSIPVSPRLTRDQGGTFIWPAPDNCFWLSQAYNPYRSHYGIDIVSSDDGSCRGRRIVAVADGVVTMATYHWSWGYYIRVDHGSGVVTGYAHALEGSFRVNVGDYVRAGQHLSSIGTTGNSTGYHLHFEVWLDGTRVNPLPYVYSEYLGVLTG